VSTRIPIGAPQKVAARRATVAILFAAGPKFHAPDEGNDPLNVTVVSESCGSLI